MIDNLLYIDISDIINIMEVIDMNIYIFLEYFIMFLMYSIVGWGIEVILTLINEKKFVDRGFLLGPYCPIYGYGMLLIVFLLRKYTDEFVVLFILSMVICLSLEYVVSYVMEVIFKARWWDYSSKKYNINGRICLEYGFLFGIGGTLIMYVVHPFIVSVISNFSNLGILIIGITLLVLFIIDNVVSFNVIFKIKGFEFKDYVDNTEEISNLVKEYLMENSWFTKRLVRAFPDVRVRIEKFKKKYKN